MKLYHGTNKPFTEIELSKSQVGKDFGCGFYLSANEAQARELAEFKTNLLGGTPTILTYEFDETVLHNDDVSFQSFDAYTREWAEFVFANRNNRQRENIHTFDIVYGPIANDKVGVQIRNVLENNIDMETFLKRLQYMKGITFQYFFATEKALKLLRQL
ncbi:MAG: DUF3990 domain-containing protein [Bacteroidaceae bacterium]|nr:DUF3990 domain-containing protein [Bacteroidaceae bacterium]